MKLFIQLDILTSDHFNFKNWLRYKNGVLLTPYQLYNNLENIFFGISNLQKLKKDLYNTTRKFTHKL